VRLYVAEMIGLAKKINTRSRKADPDPGLKRSRTGVVRDAWRLARKQFGAKSLGCLLDEIVGGAESPQARQSGLEVISFKSGHSVWQRQRTGACHENVL